MRFLLFFIIFSLIFPRPLLAASFIIDSQTQVYYDSLFKVDILVDTENSEINALGGSVSYQGDGLVLEDVRNGGSLVSLWLDEPALDKSLNGRLEFNGIIPGGYSGSKGYLFSLIFKVDSSVDDSLRNKNIAINLSDVKVLLNDGEGTELKAKAVAKKIVPASDQATAGDNSNIHLSSAAYQEAADRFPPEKFTPLIYRSPNETENNLYIAFSTDDKQSGMSHYEIAKNKNLTTNYQRLSWTKVTSPRIIEAGDLKQFVYVKAVDRQGNFQVAVIEPTATVAPSPLNKVIFVIGVCLVLLIVLLVIRRRFIKK